ncbi:putative bifunctional diguanylate cyclase/phosphodiesterase [Agarivorans sp. MS3-6]|uniref:putative bifunctional diguanylate cyclase/phosphodiesterase n=1 Tax=Agarivorans sp. TSD2052 TaxID=2937286 RepID=UPI00200D46FE|nr:EAL domain-containing protein [Agarivorans sp. TSD2052]UPW18067.1 EAL domain-containing protein [Agarivorans sp. TSD2052]
MIRFSLNSLLKLPAKYKKGLLSLVVSLFIVSAVICVYQLRHIIQILESPKSTTSWSVVQLQMEHRRFINELQLYRLDGTTLSQLMLRYDILWSRFPVLLEGQETAGFQSIPSAIQLVRELFKEIQRIEPLLQALPPGHEKFEQIVDRLEFYSSPINSLVNKEFQRNSEFDLKTDIKLLQLQLILSFSIGALLICGSILIVLIVRENHRNRYLANHDVLTGLPNRAGLREFIASLNQDKRDYAIMVLDLNGFKGINDSYGHEYGDQILNLVGQRLDGQMRHCDFAVRLGGDEFAIVQTRVRSIEDCSGFAQRLINVIEKPMSLEGRECFVGTSIGISTALDSDDDWLTILGQADTAMYQAKHEVRGSSWQFFEGEMQLAKEREQQLLSQFREALEQQQLCLFYQPIVDLSTEKVVGAEAQVRWQHPTFGWVEQAELVDIAHACGCVVILESWVLKVATQQLKRWHHGVSPHLQLAVSISSTTLHGELLVLVNKVLIESRILPHRLIINIIDSDKHMLLSCVDAIRELRRIGVSLCLDNFGSAECPLELLNHLPVQYLRGAKSLMADLLTSPDKQPMLTATVMFANRLGVKLIVPGIDNEQHLAQLKAITKDVYVLGSAFASWAPAEEFSPYLRNLSLKDPSE